MSRMPPSSPPRTLWNERPQHPYSKAKSKLFFARSSASVKPRAGSPEGLHILRKSWPLVVSDRAFASLITALITLHKEKGRKGFTCMSSITVGLEKNHGQKSISTASNRTLDSLVDQIFIGSECIPDYYNHDSVLRIRLDQVYQKYKITMTFWQNVSESHKNKVF